MRLEARPPNLTAKDRQFVAKHEDLQLLGSVAAAEADTGKGDLQQTGDADATGVSTALAPHPIEYLHPTCYRSRPSWYRSPRRPLTARGGSSIITRIPVKEAPQ